MADMPSARPTAVHCYGIILHHRRRWWLVGFPDLDGTPTAAYRLTGRLTSAMATRLGHDADDAEASRDIAMIQQGSRCWSGEFSLSPARDSANAFDIGAHPWGAEASEREERLARVMIDSTLHPLPTGFLSILSALPQEDRPVLAIRLSGYSSSIFELLTARYMPTHRPRSPWRDVSGDAISDSGDDILGWTPAEDWIRPV
ncbi:hypothetical protein [Sphingomonas oryzagri]